MNRYPPLPPEIKELMGLVRAGRLFDVQRWIQAGKPVTTPKPYVYSPLRTAIQTGFHSMVEVLLQAGTDREHLQFLFSRQIWAGNFELVKLFVHYGADIKDVSMEAVFESGDTAMMRFFLDAGLDPVTGNPFALALRSPKRPHLGVYLAYKDKIPDLTRQLNLALKYHAREGNLKWVCLLLWAGADPHVKLPDMEGDDSDPDSYKTALEDAVRAGKREVIEKIGFKSPKLDLKTLLEEACSNGDTKTIEKLLALGANLNPPGEYGPMERLMTQLRWAMDPFFSSPSSWDVEKALNALLWLADRGGKLTEGEDHSIRYFRRGLYCLDGRLINKIIAGFRDHSVCTHDYLLKVISTPKMKALLGTRYPKLAESLGRMPQLGRLSSNEKR